MSHYEKRNRMDNCKSSRLQLRCNVVHGFPLHHFDVQKQAVVFIIHSYLVALLFCEIKSVELIFIDLS